MAKQMNKLQNSVGFQPIIKHVPPKINPKLKNIAKTLDIA